MNTRPTPLAAVLQGKLGVVKHHEDFTTAMVFGVLEWLPYAIGLGPILHLAGIDPNLHCGTTAPRIELWPWWNHDPNGAGAEPDVVITLTDEQNHEHIVVIEAKRGSGLGHQQLLRQASNATILANTRRSRVAGLVFLTEYMGRSPEITGQESVNGVPLRSVSWRDVGPVLASAARAAHIHPMVRAMASDAAAVLERWNLTRFQGVPHLTKISGWSFPAASKATP